MCVVVPRKEFLAVGAGVLDTTKAWREFRTIFERLEVCFRIGVVIRDVRAAVCLGYLQIHQEFGHYSKSSQTLDQLRRIAAILDES